MTSERMQRRIERLLDQADEAAEALDWARVHEVSLSVLAADPDNADAQTFIAMAEPHLGPPPRPADEGEESDSRNDVGAGSGPPEGGYESAPTRAASPVAAASPEALEGRVPPGALPPTLPPLPSAGEGWGEGDPRPSSFANGRYAVSKFLGEGGKKRVYQARDTLLDREVAFALIKTDGMDQTSRERISREAQAMGRLGVHPNIVAVLDLGHESDGAPYMVTELMGGGDIEGLLGSNDVGAGSGPPVQPTPRSSPSQGEDDLRSALPAGEGLGEGEGSRSDGAVEAGSGPPVQPTPQSSPSQGEDDQMPPPWGGGGSEVGRNALPLERVIDIAKSVCEGLDFAHGRGIVHRDLKPGNVWLTEDGAAKIGDFGLAMLTDRSRLTREASMIGTPYYMPPEQATGGDMTARSDLYSLGAMLYEMVTGRPPFLGDDEIAIISQHINTPPVAPAWHNPGCPAPLESLIVRLLAKDPAERPESAQDVFNALDAIDLTARGEAVEQDQTSLESLAGGVFVGRQAEMDQLKAALEEVLGGSGRLVTLVGEPGIGKTRTSEELATYAGLRGAQVLWGRCYETGGQPPYWPWVQAIRSYVREAESDEIRRHMGASASVISEIVADVSEKLPETGTPPAVEDPDSARFRLFDSISSFLKSASQSRPLVLVLDDLHWSDQPTLTFLEFLAREIGQSRVMLLCTYRDMELNRRHPLSVTLGDLARERLYERVLLRGLSQNDIGRFIEIAAGVNPPVELSATVHRHTEGNPLFVTEVVRDLVQSGELAESAASGASTWSVRIPEGVREVIGRRLDRLGERTNDVLTIAAVVGRDFHLDLMQELVEDTTEGQLLDVIDEALDARIIEELSDEIGHYQFTHALMQETLTGELSLTRRVRVHARIAETLELLYGARADDHAAELAHHFGEAETLLGSDRMVHYLRIAGEEALRSYNDEEAVRSFERALASTSDDEDPALVAHLRTGLGKALGTQRRTDDAFAQLAPALEYFAESGDHKNAIDIAGIVWVAADGMIRNLDFVNRALEFVRPESADHAALLISLTRSLAVGGGDPQEIRSALEHARAIVDELDDPALELAAFDAHRLASTFGQSVPTWTEEEIDRVIELSERLGNPLSMSAALPFKAAQVRNEGRLDEALKLLDSGIEFARRSGNRERISTANIYGMQICTESGLWDRARSYFEGHRAAWSSDGRGPAFRTMVEYLTGNFEVGDQFLDGLRTLDNPDDTGESFYKEMQLAAAGGVLARIRGNPDLAIEAMPVIDRMLANPATNAGFRRMLRMALPEALVASGELGRAREVVSDPNNRIDPATIELSNRGWSFWWLASYARAISVLETDEDEDLIWHRIIDDSRSTHRPVALAWFANDYAEILLDRNGPGDAEKAKELQDEALALAQELGMPPLVERILKRRELLKA